MHNPIIKCASAIAIVSVSVITIVIVITTWQSSIASELIFPRIYRMQIKCKARKCVATFKLSAEVTKRCLLLLNIATALPK